MTGPELRAARLRMGLRQHELARFLGRKQQNVHQWEAGICRCPMGLEAMLREIEAAAALVRGMTKDERRRLRQ